MVSTVTVGLLWSMVVIQTGVAAHMKRQAPGALQRRVIENYLQHLDTLELNHPDIVKLVQMVSNKMGVDEECALMGNTSCQLYISSNSNRGSRAAKLFIPILKDFIQGITKKHFPQIGSMVSKIFAANNTLPDFADKFQISSDVLVLKTLAKVNSGIEHMKKFKVPVVTLSAIMLVFLLVLFLSKAATAIEKCRERKAQRKAAKMQSYFEMRQRAIEL